MTSFHYELTFFITLELFFKHFDSDQVGPVAVVEVLEVLVRTTCHYVCTNFFSFRRPPLFCIQPTQKTYVWFFVYALRGRRFVQTQQAFRILPLDNNKSDIKNYILEGK